MRKSYRDIEALEPPEDLEASVQEWLEVNREGLRVLERLPAAARARDSTEAQSILRRADTSEQRASELARDIGFKTCSE